MVSTRLDNMDALKVVFLTTLGLLVPSASVDQCLRRVCIYNSVAQHRPTPETKFLPEDIDPTLCTHIVYAQVTLLGNTVVPTETNDQSSESVVGNYEKVIKLKEKAGGLKVLLLLSGSYCDRGSFFAMSSSNSSRKEFVQNIIKYLRKHKFDGLVLFCGFFETYINLPTVKESLTSLTAELRGAFNEEATNSERLELALTVYGISIINDNCYDIPSLTKNVDWIDMKAHDLYGYWNGKTSHHGPLYPEMNKGMRFSLDTAVQHWLKRGTPSNKIVIDVPAFGVSFTLTTSQTDDGAPATNGRGGPYTKLYARLAYYEICSLIQANGTSLFYLYKQREPYLVSGNQWVGYDNILSVTLKITFMKKRGLGGFVIDELDMDDFKGYFCKEGKYPLLKAANNECNI